MIETVEQLQKNMISASVLEDDPIFRRPYLMTSPGCSNLRLSALMEKLPKLPRGYVNLLSMYSFNGIMVDEFELSPYSFRDLDVVDGLLKSIDDPFFPKEFMERHGLYQIGSYNTDLICVSSGTDQFSEGEVLYIEEGDDIYDPQDSQIHALAKDFEEFLIIAGNLHETRETIEEDESNFEEKKLEFMERLKILNVDVKYHQAWVKFI